MTVSRGSVPDPVRRNLPTLTALRAFAALFVFVFHLQTLGFNVPAARLVGLGYTGVAFFFVLSGFVLAWTYRPGRASQFFLRRFARIYPSHLVMVGAAAVLPLVEVVRSWTTLLPVLLLVQSFFSSNYYYYAFNSVSWTLSCEAFFYLLFPITFLVMSRLRHGFRFGVAMLALAGVIVTLYLRPELTALWFHWPPARFAEFLVGVALACELRSGWRVPGLRLAWVVPATILCMAGVAFVVDTPFLPNPLLAVPYAVIIVAAAQGDVLRRSGGWLASRPLVYAGKVSFAFYLVHVLVMINLGPYLVGPGWCRATTMFVASCGMAVLLHHGVERPLQQLIVAKVAGRLLRSPLPRQSESA